MRQLFFALLCTIVCLSQADRCLGEETVIKFSQEIRPLLADFCFHCHGPDSNTRQANLRLDTAEGLAEHGVVVAGHPDSSALFQRLTSDDPTLKMPPAESHKQLTPEQINKIRQWILQGAEYQSHWSFQPRMTLELADANLTSDSQIVDHFIDRKLAEKNLQASPVADRRTLLRRLSFDLTGLPPTPTAVAAFVDDVSQDAYHRQVESLLASPHFGERMAMWWLDQVRYADTVGYHGDQEMSVWPFRDYVIESFNTNKPFDQFTREQLAGDLLPNPSKTMLIASGYNRLGMMSAEGGVQEKEYLAKYIAERVRNVSGTWLGLTMGCCECHDHKFDPLSAKEFYQMEAFFADIKERGLYSGSESTGKWGSYTQVPSPEQEQQLAKLNQAIVEANASIDQADTSLDAAQIKWEQYYQQWHLLQPVSMQASNGTLLALQPDGSILASGDVPDNDTYQLIFANLPQGITALRLEVLPDDTLPKRGPGRAGNGNFVLSEFVAEVQNLTKTQLSTDGPEKAQQLTFVAASASYEQTGAAGGNPYAKWSIQAAIDADAKGAKWGWAIMEQVGQRHQAVFQFNPDSPVNIKPDQQLHIILRQNLDNPKHTIGRFRLWCTSVPVGSVATEVVPGDVAEILDLPKRERTDQQVKRLADYYRQIAPELQPARERLADLNRQRSALEKEIPVTLITETVAPRTIRVLGRGNWMDESGEVVQPDFPSAISLASWQRSEDRRLTRADLADWIVAPDNPLTARVVVNRLWKIYFGAGLARKLDDLGAQGEPPTHPEVLDFLASRLVESGWDIKQLIRTMVRTQTYQRSSLASREAMAVDPQNLWLARQAKFRLDAELVRDNALAISGLLVRRVGGKSVKPYQPPGYWAYLNFPTREWTNGKDDELYRRGVYTHWQRQYLHPSLMAFDAPSREECTADRPRSNTPLQSLALLNDPTYVEAARAFAMQLTQIDKDDHQRIEIAFQQALSRPPSERESQLLLELLQRARQEYDAQPSQADQLLSVGALPVQQPQQAKQIAAWTAVTRAILNLHESITRN